VYVIVLQFRDGWKLALLLAVLAGVAVTAEGSKIVHAFGSGHSGTVQRRLDVWRSSIHMIRAHPIVGIGPDNFLHYYAPVKQPYSPCSGLGFMQPEASDEPCLSHPHDVVLDFWLSAGLIGLSAFLWLEYVFWRRALQLWKICRGSPTAAMLAGIMAAMLASLLHGLVDNSYFLPDLALLFWLLCGYVSYGTTTRDRTLRDA
jgi:O-antigen ligase